MSGFTSAPSAFHRVLLVNYTLLPNRPMLASCDDQAVNQEEQTRRLPDMVNLGCRLRTSENAYSTHSDA